MFARLFRRLAAKVRPGRPALPELRYTDTEYERVRRLQGAHGFGCNQWRQVWPRQKFGLTREQDRHQVRGQSGLLDRLVALLLKREPLGGAFYVTPRGAYLAKNDDCFATLARADGLSP